MRPLLCTILLFISLASAQEMDPDIAESVKEWTTKPEFLSPLECNPDILRSCRKVGLLVVISVWIAAGFFSYSVQPLSRTPFC